MNFFDHKDLGNHLLQLCPKVVKHPVHDGLFKLVYCIEVLIDREGCTAEKFIILETHIDAC
jgi:hypothetical protein